jgi:hypothetical protein
MIPVAFALLTLHSAYADFYVIPIKPKTAGPGCVAYYGLEYCEIVSATTGKIWLDRNLGSPKVCSAYNDTQCYGDYYQWGRNADGHQKSDSITSNTRLGSLGAKSDKFVIGYEDWTVSDGNGSLRSANWNPCPPGYRIPTIDELSGENVGDRDGAFSKLKLPAAGEREIIYGSLDRRGSYGFVWSASPTYRFVFYSSAYTAINYPTRGLSVRCLK